MAQRAHSTLDGHPEVKEELHIFLYSWELASHLLEHDTHSYHWYHFTLISQTHVLINECLMNVIFFALSF